MQQVNSPAAEHSSPKTPPSAASHRMTVLPEPIFLGILLLLWLTATSWMRPLSLPDEGRYVGVAWEMVRSGNWLTPTINGLPYFHKPPLFYWLTASSLSNGPRGWPRQLARCSRLAQVICC